MIRVSKLRSLAYEVYSTVGPARIGGVVLTLAIERHRAGATPVPLAQVGVSRRRIAAAHDMLVNVIAGEVAQIRHPVSPRIVEAREVAAEHLSALIKHMPARVPDAEIVPTLAAAGLGFEQLVERMHGTVDRYLDLAMDNVRVLADEQTRTNEADVGKLLGDMRKVGMGIELIAINAAIEASHSGQQGAGFAVIAQEVQRLSAQMGSLIDQAEDRLGAL